MDSNPFDIGNTTYNGLDPLKRKRLASAAWFGAK
jgi:hypothetical protein